jgi:hypothetical protein
MVRNFKCPRFEGDGIFSPRLSNATAILITMQCWLRSPAGFSRILCAWFGPAGDDGRPVDGLNCRGRKATFDLVQCAGSANVPFTNEIIE